MKNKIAIFCSVALSGILAHGAVIEVGEISPLAKEVHVTGRPVISADDSFVVVSDGTDLLKIGMADSSVEKIGDGRNVYALELTPDNESISFLRAGYGDDKLRYNSLEAVNLGTKVKSTVVKNSRSLTTGQRRSGDSVRASVGISYGHLTVNGEAIDPQGKGSYLWPSLSPDGKRIVYWCVGQGCFVCDIDGRNAVALGELRAPVWSGNAVVIGMRDRDNGMFVTESSLVACNPETQEQQTITPADVVAMYPAATESRIVFTDAEGHLFYMDIHK